jgi:hypothetical protein
VYLWERASGGLIRRVELPDRFDPRQLVVTRDGVVLVLGATRDRGTEEGCVEWVVWDARARKPLLTTSAFREDWPVALCGQGRTLAEGCEDSSILLYDVPRPAATEASPLRDGEFPRLWRDLSSRDARRAFRAGRRLAGAPDDAIALLRGRLKPAPAAVEAIADLDGDFSQRQAAEKKFREALRRGDRATELALCELVASPPSLEPWLRARRLLMQAKPIPFTADELRAIRAMGVLEQIASDEAKELLKRLSEGGPSLLTTEARAALARLPKG